MYIPTPFNVSDQKELFAFIKANAFGQLISSIDNRPFVSHIPFLLDEGKKTVSCHLAKNNPQWKNIENQELLITFQGAHDYVSPSWYSNAGVPTWNYQAVHIYGKATLITKNKALATLVETLSNTYESSMQEPWQPEYKEAMLKAIIGIEIEITEIQGKYKLSQNRPKADRLHVIEESIKRDSIELAQAMKDTL